jgi:hypothetical protein
VARIAGHLFGLLALLSAVGPAVGPAVGAQPSTPLTRFGIWREPYAPYVACHELNEVPEGLRDQGIVRAFQVAEAATGRSGTLGLDRRGMPRYLLVNITASTTQMGRQLVETEISTVHFLPDGGIEVGRRGVYRMSNDTTLNHPPEIYGLSVPEADLAIGLARRFRVICFERLRRR